MSDNNKDQEEVTQNGNGEIDTQDGNTAAPANSSGKKNKKGKAKKSGEQAVTPSQANLTPEQQGNLKKAMEYLSLQAAGSLLIVMSSCGEFKVMFLHRPG